MKIALCQINATIGDFSGNVSRMLQAAGQAEAAGASLGVFPELSITGYPPRDLLDRPSFLAAAERALQELAERAPAGIALLVGAVEVERGGPQPRLYNVAALVSGGRVQQTFRKRLLPHYDVFDEPRYFSVGQLPLTFMHGGVRIGVNVCEDAWNDASTELRRHYAQNPVQFCRDEGAEVIINLSASPFTLAKHVGRAQLFSQVARRHGVPLAVVNMVGGNDDLIFDGGSVVFNADGSLLARAERFAEDVLICDLGSAQGGRIAPQCELAAGAVFSALVLGVRDYARKCGFQRALLGLSGGIDSALVAAIAAEALGPDRVLALSMPTRYSSAGSLADAEAVARQLGIAHRVIDIDPVFQTYINHLTPLLQELGPAPAADTTFENVQARIRGNTLMAVSNRHGHLLLTTGNKSEVAVGYCTLYGDMAGGLAAISDVPKTFVYEVSREVNRRAGRAVIPETVLTKAPSAELRPDQTDQDSLPPYEILDAILERLINGQQGQEEIVSAGFDAEVVDRVAHLVQISEYKRRQMPPGLIVTSKAFGPGRRVPIAQRYRYRSTSGA